MKIEEIHNRNTWQIRKQCGHAPSQKAEQQGKYEANMLKFNKQNNKENMQSTMKTNM